MNFDFFLFILLIFDYVGSILIVDDRNLVGLIFRLIRTILDFIIIFRLWNLLFDLDYIGISTRNSIFIQFVSGNYHEFSLSSC